MASAIAVVSEHILGLTMARGPQVSMSTIIVVGNAAEGLPAPQQRRMELEVSVDWGNLNSSAIVTCDGKGIPAPAGETQDCVNVSATVSSVVSDEGQKKSQLGLHLHLRFALAQNYEDFVDANVGETASNGA